MSIFNELLPRLLNISNTYTKNHNDILTASLDSLTKYEEEFVNRRAQTKEPLKNKNPATTLQIINEDDGEPSKSPRVKETKRRSSKTVAEKNNEVVENVNEINKNNNENDPVEPNNESARPGKKRSKDEVDGMSSPEVDKRPKRNASVRAQSVISKQAMEVQKLLQFNKTVLVEANRELVNVNLTQKLRREDSIDSKTRASKSRRKKDDDKENDPLSNIKIKQEKISIPSEPMDLGSLPIDVNIKHELSRDDIAMPPPAAPLPKSRKGQPKDKDENVETSTRRSNRNKASDTMPPPPAPSTRSARSSSRAKQQETEEPVIPIEPRPKRTRTKKVPSEKSISDLEKDNQASQENNTEPLDKPRPKRTRRGQKAAEKAPEATPESNEESEKQKSPENVLKTRELATTEIESTKTQDNTFKTKDDSSKSKEISLQSIEIIQKSPENIKSVSESEISTSPILLLKDTKSKKYTETKVLKQNSKKTSAMKSKLPTRTKGTLDKQSSEESDNIALEETQIISGTNMALNETVVLPNGVYNHAPFTPNNIRNLDETVIIDKVCRETIVLDKRNGPMDATVVLDRDPKTINVTDDNSIMTEDNSDVVEQTPPKQEIKKAEPTSAVKEKVQQFEELASRTTRTKTRAMAKKDSVEENQTPPDKIIKTVLTAETLAKMNSMIFNGKTQISSSSTKPTKTTALNSIKVHSSASKLVAINKAKEEENAKREKESAKMKKEALLEAKREQQRRKREEKMAAAAATREAAERERKAAMEAMAKERQEKQAHADQGKLERLREVERKKLELARKAAETEERRKAEEQARQQRLEEEQRRADALRKKQQLESEATKREALMMAKEIEKKTKEYKEKQMKLKQKLEADKNTPLKYNGHPAPMEPVYMADGFQYLNSDEEEDAVPRPIPAWSTSKARYRQLAIQNHVAITFIDKFFSVRTHSPDLREIFPNVDRRTLKRTSSAVWRTPPAANRLPTLQESPI